MLLEFIFRFSLDPELVYEIMLDLLVAYTSPESINFYFFYSDGISFLFLSLSCLCYFEPFNNIFSTPKVGAYINNESIVATIVDQNISEITVYIAEYGYQYKSILPENVPAIITIKCTR